METVVEMKGVEAMKVESPQLSIIKMDCLTMPLLLNGCEDNPLKFTGSSMLPTVVVMPIGSARYQQGF